MPEDIHNGEEIDIRITWKYFCFQKLNVYIIIEVIGHHPQYQ